MLRVGVEVAAEQRRDRRDLIRGEFAGRTRRGHVFLGVRHARKSRRRVVAADQIIHLLGDHGRERIAHDHDAAARWAASRAARRFRRRREPRRVRRGETIRDGGGRGRRARRAGQKSGHGFILSGNGPRAATRARTGPSRLRGLGGVGTRALNQGGLEDVGLLFGEDGIRKVALAGVAAERSRSSCPRTRDAPPTSSAAGCWRRRRCPPACLPRAPARRAVAIASSLVTRMTSS